MTDKAMSKRLIFLASIAIASVTWAQDTKFSYSGPAGTAKTVFEQLSKASGVSLIPGGQVASDPILVNVKDVTVDELRAKIAEALKGEWRKEGSGWVLHRGPNIEAAELRTEMATRVAQFKQNLATAVAEQAQVKNFNDDEAKKLNAAQEKMKDEMGRQAGSGAIRISGDFNSISRKTPAARAIASLPSARPPRAACPAGWRRRPGSRASGRLPRASRTGPVAARGRAAPRPRSRS